MKARMYGLFSSPRNLRLFWIAAALLALAVAGGAPDDVGIGLFG